MLISAFFLLHIETFKFQIFHDSFPVNKCQTGSEAGHGLACGIAQTFQAKRCATG